MEKTELIKRVIQNETSDLETAKRLLSDAPSKYFGEELKRQEKLWSEDVAMIETKIEALELLLEQELIIDCPECEKEHDKDMSCLQAGAIRVNI